MDIGDNPEDLRAFLAATDVRCPSCAYNLRGLTSSACPECGWFCSLAVLRVPPPLPWWRPLTRAQLIDCCSHIVLWTAIFPGTATGIIIGMYIDAAVSPQNWSVRPATLALLGIAAALLGPAAGALLWLRLGRVRLLAGPSGWAGDAAVGSLLAAAWNVCGCIWSQALAP